MKALFILIITLLNVASLNAKPIIFAPLPQANTQRVFEDFNPMILYLEKTLNEHIELRYEKRYDDIIEQFKANKIDIAYFGPLPFVALYKQFPSAQPIITFHENDGQNGYRCALVKFAKDTVNFQDNPRPKIALTQPLSTCGYTKTKMLLKEYYNQDLSKMLYRYMGKHDEVALSVIRGEFLLGGMKESIAHEYQSLGLQIITTSPLLPGFSLVVNTQTLSSEQIESIKKALLSAPKEVYETWGKELSHGMSEPDLELFQSLSVEILEFEIPPVGNVK